MQIGITSYSGMLMHFLGQGNFVRSEPAFSEMAESLKGLYSRGRLIVVLILAVIGFCLIVNSSWNATPDSALYLSLGESISRGQGYVFNGEPHTFVPPGLPLIIAGTARVFGADFFSYRALMAITGFLAAVFGFLLVARVAGRDIAVLVGSVFVPNYVLLYNSTFILADVPFALFTFIALHGVLSAKDSPTYAWLAVAAGLMAIPCLIRINGIAIPFAAAVFFFSVWKDLSKTDRVIRIAFFLIVSSIPFVLWQYWKASFPVSESEGTYLNAVAGRQWSDQVRVIVTALLEYFPEGNLALTGISVKTGFLEVPVPLLTLFGMVQACRKGERLFVSLTVLQFCGLVLTSAGTRYIIFLLPGLYLFLALGIFETAKLARHRYGFPAPERVLIIAFLVFGALNLGHNVAVVREARHPLEKGGAQNDRSSAFFSAARWLKANAPDAIVLTGRPRIIHYLSGCRTVSLVRSGVPDHEIYLDTLDRLKQVTECRAPDFLYSDAKDLQYHDTIIRGLNSLGLGVEKVPEASSERYLLFRIVPLPEKR
jgi:4-amino-4-deoxy-L-arabinose transferase-like glycosyltransferase